MEQRVPEWGLRSATVRDHDFLQDLHQACLKPYVEATWGWDEALQRRIFDERFDPAKVKIVTLEGEGIGELAVEDRPMEIFLARILIHPRFQRRGIGAAITRAVLEEGRRRGMAVTLTVLKVNPARALYERLGFVVTGQDPHRYFMNAPE